MRSNKFLFAFRAVVNEGGTRTTKCWYFRARNDFSNNIQCVKSKTHTTGNETNGRPNRSKMNRKVQVFKVVVVFFSKAERVFAFWVAC